MPDRAFLGLANFNNFTFLEVKQACPVNVSDAAVVVVVVVLNAMVDKIEAVVTIAPPI